MNAEQFQLYQEQTFDSFCKKLIRNTSIDIFREYAHREKHEVLFSALPYRDFSALATEDIYIHYQKTFTVCGHHITVCNRALGDALQYIHPQQRQVILLFYYLGFSDAEIGLLLNISYQVARLRRLRGLNHLQELLEVSPYG